MGHLNQSQRILACPETWGVGLAPALFNPTMNFLLTTSAQIIVQGSQEPREVGTSKPIHPCPGCSVTLPSLLNLHFPLPWDFEKPVAWSLIGKSSYLCAAWELLCLEARNHMLVGLHCTEGETAKTTGPVSFSLEYTLGYLWQNPCWQSVQALGFSSFLLFFLGP